MEPNSGLRGLLIRYISDEISAGERSALYQLLAADENGPAIESILAALSEQAPADPNYRESDWQDLIQNILRTKPKNKILFFKKTWIRVAAAAAILLLITGSYFFFFNKPPKQIILTQSERYKNDVLPGGNKAILTLGNGQQIILDTTRNGLLAKQNNTNIIKTDSGKLSYHITNEKPTEILYNTLSTPRGGQYQLTLPDGSEVWLNAASSIKYPTVFNGNERVVEITGEAYFEVKHNSKMPFKVKANNEVIEDLGTHFNINAYADEPIQKTTLLEGSIKIKTENNSNNNNSNNISNNSAILKPGQQSQIINDKISIVSDVDVDGVVAWKNGKFAFTELSMEEIMRQISRWYDADIVFDQPVPGHFVADISRKEPVSKLLKLLELTDRVHFKIENKKITVMK